MKQLNGRARAHTHKKMENEIGRVNICAEQRRKKERDGMDVDVVILAGPALSLSLRRQRDKHF